METRRIILDVLLEYEKEGTMLRPLLTSVLEKYGYLEKRDKAFIKTVCEGVIERQMTLDYVINMVSSLKVKKMKPVIKQIVRMGAYQILFMDHVPDRAAVNEAVKLTRIKHIDGLRGFVNGVLRGVIKERDKGIEYPDLQTQYSCPYWIAERFLEYPGGDVADKMIKSCADHPELYFRVNPLKTGDENLIGILKGEGIEVCRIKGEGIEAGRIKGEGVEACKTSVLSEKLKTKAIADKKSREESAESAESAENEQNSVSVENAIADRDDGYNGILKVTDGNLNPSVSESFRAGYYSVQDLSSQIAVKELWTKYNEIFIKPKREVDITLENEVDINILDLCAAPGGKSCCIAELTGGRGKVKACDISEKKTDKIRENIKRLGLTNVDTLIRDAEEYDESEEGFYDIVIADLPCSGLGVIRRKVDIKYRVQPEDIVALCKLQRTISDNAVRYLKIGGMLLFSVCTVTKEESIMQSEYIENKGLHKVTERAFYQGEDPCDGFYYAIFTK